MAIPAYPTEFPGAEAWGIVQQLITGQGVANPPHAVHVGYVCAGYALGQFYADQVIGVGSGAVTAENAIAGFANGLAFAGAVPWLQIATLIIQAILTFLNKGS